MRCDLKSLVTAALFAGAVMLVGHDMAMAKGDTTGYFPSFNIGAGYGLTTYKSEFLEANDTAGETFFHLGIHAFDSKAVGMEISSNSLDVDFERNSSKLAYELYHVKVYYNAWGLKIGISLDYGNVAAQTTDDEEYLTLLGYGTGYFVGFDYEFNRGTGIFVKYQSFAFADATTVEANDLEGGFEMTSDMAIGVRFNAWRIRSIDSILYIDLGMNQRIYTFTRSGDSKADAYSSTFLAFSLASDE